MINGADYKKFLKEFKAIRQTVTTAPLQSMNAEIARQLQEICTSIENGTYSSATPHNEDNSSDETQTDIALPSAQVNRRSSRHPRRPAKYDPSDTPETTPSLQTIAVNECILCDRNVEYGESALRCTECDSWFHMGCDDAITPVVYEQHNDDPSLPYYCLMCAYDRAYEFTTNGSDVNQDECAPAHKSSEPGTSSITTSDGKSTSKGKRGAVPKQNTKDSALTPSTPADSSSVTASVSTTGAQSSTPSSSTDSNAIQDDRNAHAPPDLTALLEQEKEVK